MPVKKSLVRAIRGVEETSKQHWRILIASDQTDDSLGDVVGERVDETGLYINYQQRSGHFLINPYAR